MHPVQTLRSGAPLSKRSSTTVSVRVDLAAVGRIFTSSTTFCIHGWSSGAGYAALNHWRPCYCRRRSTCLEQSSSRSAPMPDIFYFRNTPEVTSVQQTLQFDCIIVYFLYWALEAACAAYAHLNLSLLHYITFQFWQYSFKLTYFVEILRGHWWLGYYMIIIIFDYLLFFTYFPFFCLLVYWFFA